jgi:hypothetical protein
LLVDTFLKCEANVAALDVAKTVLEQKAASMKWDSKLVLLLEADIRIKNEIKNVFDTVVKEFGCIHTLLTMQA